MGVICELDPGLQHTHVIVNCGSTVFVHQELEDPNSLPFGFSLPRDAYSTGRLN